MVELSVDEARGRTGGRRGEWLALLQRLDQLWRPSPGPPSGEACPGRSPHPLRGGFRKSPLHCIGEARDGQFYRRFRQGDPVDASGRVQPAFAGTDPTHRVR
jgi:hypothetical protein